MTRRGTTGIGRGKNLVWWWWSRGGLERQREGRPWKASDWRRAGRALEPSVIGLVWYSGVWSIHRLQSQYG